MEYIEKRIYLAGTPDDFQLETIRDLSNENRQPETSYQCMTHQRPRYESSVLIPSNDCDACHPGLELRQLFVAVHD